MAKTVAIIGLSVLLWASSLFGVYECKPRHNFLSASGE